MLAAVYGILSGNGIWYPMNLLVAGLFPAMATETASQIGTFNLSSFLVAVPIHLLISLLVGLLYGAMLPMAPRRPILLGGFVAPLLWSGLIYGMLAVINPVMNQRIDWLWFVLSQIGFGIVAGLVVARQERIPTRQLVPLIARMGIEAPGIMAEHDGNKQHGGAEADEVCRPEPRDDAGDRIVWSAGPPGRRGTRDSPQRSRRFPSALRAELLRMPRSRWTGGIERGDRQARVPRHRRRCHDPPRHRGGQAGNRDAGFCAESRRDVDGCPD